MMRALVWYPLRAWGIHLVKGQEIYPQSLTAKCTSLSEDEGIGLVLRPLWLHASGRQG